MTGTNNPLIYKDGPSGPTGPSMYVRTCARGRYAFAERVKKKTGTKWDRDQAGRPNEAVGSLQNDGDRLHDAPPHSTYENKPISALLRPFLGNPKKDRPCTRAQI